MKLLSLLLLFISTFALAQPQHSKEFTRLLSQADSLTRAGIYAAAYYKYNAAKAADPNQSGIADKRIAQMLLQINAERSTADSLQYLYELRSKQLEKINYYLGFIGGRAWVYSDSLQLFAMIDERGTQLTDFRFSEPQPFADDKKDDAYQNTIAKENGRWVVVNRQGKVISAPFDWRIATQKGDYVVYANNQWFIYNNSFKEKAGPFIQIDDEGLAFWAQNTDKMWGLLDKVTGRWLSKPQYDEVSFFKNGFAPVQRNGKWGCINTDGKEVINAQYDLIGNINSGYAYYQKNGMFGFVNINGKEIGPTQWENAGDFSQGVAAVQLGGKWGYLDSLGNLAIRPKFFAAEAFSDGLAVVAFDEKKWTVIDQKGDPIFNKKHQNIDKNGFSDSLLWVQDNRNRWGAVNRIGEEIIAHQYDSITPFAQGKAWVAIDKKWGIIDKKGNILLPIQWEEYKDSGTGLIAIKRIGLWGFIDRNGKEVIAPKYHNAHPFSDDLAAVILNNRAGYIQPNGDWLVTRNFIQSFAHIQGIAWASEKTNEGERFGLINKEGNWIALPQFEIVEQFKNGQAWVSKLSSSFFVDAQGKIVVER